MLRINFRYNVTVVFVQQSQVTDKCLEISKKSKSGEKHQIADETFELVHVENGWHNNKSVSPERDSI